MESSQRKGKGKGTEELHQRFKRLEQEWKAYKESKPTATASHRHSSPPSNQTIHGLLQYSPRELMFNLQQESPSPPVARRNVTRVKHRAVRDILQERREAIERGKLKGRRLFQSTTSEDESSDGEVRSMSFCNSEDESNRSERVHGYYNRRELSSSSSSSSSCLAGDHDMEKMAHLIAMMAEMRDASVSDMRPNGRTRYTVFLGGVAIILLVIAMCMRLAKSFGGDDFDIILVPT